MERSFAQNSRTRSAHSQYQVSAFGRSRRIIFSVGSISGVTLYSPVPCIIGAEVGNCDPVSGSTVMANALIPTPSDNLGFTMVTLPCASGLNTPTGIGDPVAGMSHSSYARCAGGAGILLARKIKIARLGA